MRRAPLHLVFEGLDARQATTAVFHDNAASLGVTRPLGYEPNGVTVALQRAAAAEQYRFRMTRAEVGGVFGRWEEAVGPALAANVRPVRLEQGTLLVEVSDPVWATQVRFLADNLAAVTGVLVEHVEVRVGRPRRRS